MYICRLECVIACDNTQKYMHTLSQIPNVASYAIHQLNCNIYLKSEEGAPLKVTLHHDLELVEKRGSKSLTLLYHQQQLQQ